jgi:hypothetical protein
MNEETTDVVKKSKIWFYICILMLVGIYASIIVPSFQGVRYTANSNSASVFIGQTLIYYFVGRRYFNRGLLGALIGLFALFIVLVIANIISNE